MKPEVLSIITMATVAPENGQGSTSIELASLAFSGGASAHSCTALHAVLTALFRLAGLVKECESLHLYGEMRPSCTKLGKDRVSRDLLFHAKQLAIALAHYSALRS